MKKISLLLMLLFLIFLYGTTVSYAGECFKHFYGYELPDINIREFGVAVRSAVDAYTYADNYVPLKNVENAYIYTNGKSSYFLRIYPANTNTNIYVVANEEYDVNNNDVTRFLKEHGYKYNALDDKKALKEYQYDFYILARQQKLGNFYISPDMVKPLKVGINTLNNKMNKYTQKTPNLPYTVDTAPINLTCLDTTGQYDNDANIAIIRKEYRLKEKTGKYLRAYEYIVTNKNNSIASVTVTSEHHTNLVDVTSETMANMDRVDFVDITCSFPPVVICTAGLSLLGSVPNWIRWGTLTKEAARFTHELPKNYQLRPQGNMRVLVLKSKNSPKPLNFNFKFSDGTYNVSF